MVHEAVSAEEGPRVYTPDTIPEHIREHSKFLIDGWATTMDYVFATAQSQDGLTVEQAKLAKGYLELLARLYDNKQRNPKLLDGGVPMFVGAGNSVGVFKAFFNAVENTEVPMLLGVPEGAQKHVSNTRRYVIVYPPRSGAKPGQIDWGSELEGPSGLASVEFNVRRVILVGGGPLLENQIGIYVSNVLKARLQKPPYWYKIYAVQGVGGISDRTRLEPVLSHLAAMDEGEFSQRFPTLAGHYQKFMELFTERNRKQWLRFPDAVSALAGNTSEALLEN